MTGKNEFENRINSRLKFRLYLFYKLPAAFFSGIKVVSFSREKCITSVPYKWLTKNPFRSTYFASLAMAAEMSTGILALRNTYKRRPSISLLVTKMEANFFKKATGITFFTCTEGSKIAEAISDIKDGAKTITIKSTGKSKNGELIAEFLFTWSFKIRAKK